MLEKENMKGQIIRKLFYQNHLGVYIAKNMGDVQG